MKSKSTTEFSIGVDVQKALGVLSQNVFAGQQACIRELIANAADSISQLPPDKLNHVRIRVDRDFLKKIISISDNGIGMTRTEAQDLLGTLFGSGKSGRTDVIGQFGIGFYSCFPLCSKVEVITKSALPGDSGTRIVYSGGQKLKLEPASVSENGTTVNLHLLDNHSDLLHDDKINKLIKKDCNFIPYPICLDSDWSVLNKLDAPWYQVSNESKLRDGLKNLLGVKKVLFVTQISEHIGNLKVKGAVFILPRGVKPIFHIYSKRVLITEHDKQLLDETLLEFLSGVIDIEGIPLVISRDSIIGDSPQAGAIKKFLIRQIGMRLVQFAEDRNNEFIRLMNDFGSAIKKAGIEHDSLIVNLRNHIPYKSSIRSSVTIPDYVKRNRRHEIIYASNLSAENSLIPLYDKENLEVLFMADEEDEVLRRRWYYKEKLVRFKRIDVDPPELKSKKTEGNDGVDTQSVEALRMLFRSSINERIKLEVRNLGPNAPPAILALSDSERKKFEIIEYIRQHEKQNTIQNLPVELQELARNDFLDILSELTIQPIILNSSNGLVKELIEMLTKNSYREIFPDLPAQIAKSLHDQALLASGLDLSLERLAKISHKQSNLLKILIMKLKDRNND